MTGSLPPDDRIADRDAFVAFLSRLRADYAANGPQWENPTLDRFLEAWVAASPAAYRNHGLDLPPDGDWTFFAHALTAARIYE
ncbi:hypothetical protein [Streptomyces longwoodensis]|uniref:DUF7660 family protein n=1 Tax=Streptomyces longwoodensis TaxID=68231 RepID=UPI0030E32B29